MRSPLSPVAAATLAAACCIPGLAAQERAVFQIYPEPIEPNLAQSTSFTDRGDMNDGSGGVVLAEIPGGLVSHLGATGVGTCEITSVAMVQQDQNPQTQHQYFILFRRRDASGEGPDLSDEGLLAYAGPLPTPVGASSQPEAFDSVINFNTPFPASCDSDYFYGLEIQADPNWPSDGQSLHMAHYELGQYGDWPRVDAPGLAWSAKIGVAPATQIPAVWNLGLGSAAPVLQVGGNDPNNPGGIESTISFGAGGFYPDVSDTGRNDGLHARIGDDENAGGFAILFIGSGPAPSPFGFPGIAGVIDLDLGPGFRQFATATITNNPDWNHQYAGFPIVPPGTPTMPALLGTQAWLQALTLKANITDLHMTNRVTVDF